MNRSSDLSNNAEKGTSMRKELFVPNADDFEGIEHV